MLPHLLLVSLPNILTILLAIGLFCSPYPRKQGGAWRLGAAGAACIGMACLSAATSRLAVPLVASAFGPVAANATSIAFFCAVLICSVPIAHLVFELNRWDALFCCTAGYILQNFAHSCWELIVAFLPSGLSQAAGALGQLAISAMVFATGYATVIRQIKVRHLVGSGNKRVLLVLIAVILVSIVFDVTIRAMLNEGAIGPAPHIVLRLSHLFISILMLVLGYEILYSNRMEANAASARQMMESERRHYQLSKETIDAINLRCHDIRHQIRRLSCDNTAVSSGFLAEISELVSIYDSGVRTSNRALDVILSEKSLLCRQRGVELTCTADGAALSFMEEPDIYSLFGNALDNALDASERLADPERKVIDVSTRVFGQMVCIQIRNFYDGQIRFADGLPQTDKTDGNLHGYGMRSLRLITERYGGSLAIDSDGGIFRLSILLPKR